MSEQERIAFFERYAAIAMDQQQKYGIPASVTLAQMALESAYGTSRLAREGNNCFGVKAGSEWIKNGGAFGYYSDDKPNEKFCHYNSVEDSIIDHSRVLMLSHYKSCLQYDSTDYHNWLVGIKAGGYATASNYVGSIEDIIHKYGLDKYDRMAVQQATQPIGYLRGTNPSDQMFARNNQSAPVTTDSQERATLAFIQGHWAMPVAPDADNTIKVSSNFGHRTPPCPGASSDHKGLDISVTNVPVFATEDNGVVKSIGNNSSPSAEKNVTIVYNRPDGTSYEVKYLHLSSINVREGDIVNAGTQVAVSGSTGIGTGPHLDMRVLKNGQTINPSEYLAEISVRGGFDIQFVFQGKDLLAEYKNGMTIDFPSPVQDPEQIDQSNLMFAELTSSSDPAKWLDYLMKKEGADGLGLGGGDIIADIAGTILSGVISLGSMMGMADENEVSLTDGPEVKDETEISNETVIQRQRESVDPSRAQHIASMNYDSQTVEQGLSQGRSLA